jgi:hypothetical protein
VADYNSTSIAVFPISATGNISPTRKIQVFDTYSYPTGVSVDTEWVYVSNYLNAKIDVFPINADGNVVPTRSIRGNATSLFGPFGIAVDSRVVCPRSISPTEQSFGSAGGTGSVEVTAPTGCEWTAESNKDWITMTSGENGSGNGTVDYSVSANPGADSRIGTVTIAGKTFTVTQSGTVASPITLISPEDQTSFNGCSLYSLPSFAWSATETFKSFEVQFSITGDFGSVPARVKTTVTEIQLSSNTWKKVLLISGATGGAVYWRVVATRADKTQVTSLVRSILIEGAQDGGYPWVYSPSKSWLPTLSWATECGKKFKVWFGSDAEFSKKKSFSFNLKDIPESFSKELTASQWNSIRKLVGDKAGESIYWYIESWDGLGRYAKTGVMSFVLAE